MPWRSIRFLLYMLALLAAGFVQLERFSQEHKNKTVEMVLDLASATEYARTSGQKLDDFLKIYHTAGVRSLALSEQKWEELESRGVAGLFSGSQLALAWPGIERQHLDYAKSYVVVFQPKMLETLEQQLVLNVGRSMVRRWDSGDPARLVLEVDTPLRTLQGLGMGFSEEQARYWASKKYDLWLRPENKPAANDKTSLAVLGTSKVMPNTQGLIFGGLANEAIGYPNFLNTTIDYMRANHLKLGFIELPKAAQQKGLESLVRALPENTVRVFAVPPAQQLQLRPDRLAQMYGLAARERNARVLYIRPYVYDPSPDRGFEDANEVFIDTLSKDLNKNAALGMAGTFEHQVVLPPVLAILMAAGAAGIAWLLIDLFVVVPNWIGFSGVLTLAGITGLTCFVGPGQFWRTMMAFGCAGAVSLFAVAHLYDELEAVSKRATLWKVWWGSTLLWVRMSMWSLSGALLASAFLQETTFKLGLDTFRGVKALTLGVPLLAVVAWFARRGDWKAFLGTLSTPLKLYHLFGFAFLGAVLVLYTLRSGNTGAEMAGDALEYERHLRQHLDQILGVRPRFKEFLIAHPAMLLAPFALRWGGPYVAWLFILAGAAGQVGLPDTFAHIHTPLLVSLIRCILGGIVGYIFTALIFWPLAKFVQVLRGRRSPTSPIQSEQISN